MQSGEVVSLVGAGGAANVARRQVDAAFIRRQPLDEGVTLVHSCFPPATGRETVVHEAGSPTLVITFGLSGRSRYVARDGNCLNFSPGQATLAAFSSCSGERQFAPDEATRQLRLVLGGPALERYLGAAAMAQLVGRGGVRVIGERPVSPWCRATLGLLAAGELPVMDRHIAALTLASEYLRPWLGGSGAVLPLADADKLRQAYDLMHGKMAENLTIAYLSRTVGMNECKFKQGFRELYGITPYQMLLGIRMRRARQLLAAGWQVAQVAYAVGYAYPANFGAAFTRYFGYSPKTVVN